MYSVRVNRLKEVTTALSRLPKEVRTEVGKKATLKVAKSLLRRARYRYTSAGYGRGRTTKHGWRSMSVKSTGKGAIFEVSSPYLALIEKGMPSHWVSIETIKAHESSPGSTTGKKFGKGYPFKSRPVYWQYKGPFIKPALASLRADIPKIVKPYVDKAINKSFRR